MKIPLPKGKYIGKIEINADNIEFELRKKKKIALLLVGVNERYWSYLKQVIEDCRINFLPQHKVDFFVWSDMPDGTLNDVQIFPTDAIEWPAPTLMRYHLFLHGEEKLKDYDYIFYLDADMRVVSKVSDEVLGKGLTAAPHPGYELASKYIPPYEPNPESSAYIHRLGRIVDDNGKPRFRPFYAAGGFQGGKAKEFIKAMKEMRNTIDDDFNKNYTAIWNDESHWNKFLWDYKGDITFLDVSYVYPDSLIKEFYEPLWGRSYEPKIITLTKPFSLSKEGGLALQQMIGTNPSVGQCPTCKDMFNVPGYKIQKILGCAGSGHPHQMDMNKI